MGGTVWDLLSAGRPQDSQAGLTHTSLGSRLLALTVEPGELPWGGWWQVRFRCQVPCRLPLTCTVTSQEGMLCRKPHEFLWTLSWRGRAAEPGRASCACCYSLWAQRCHKQQTHKNNQRAARPVSPSMQVEAQGQNLTFLSTPSDCQLKS